MTKYSLIFFFIFLNLTSAYATEVRTEQVGPFNCNEAILLAQEDLKHQCQNLGLELKDFYVEECHQSGSDGGYVDYYQATAHGMCSK